jgi:hypothetical protein
MAFGIAGLVTVACAGNAAGPAVSGTQPPSSAMSTQGSADATVVDRLTAARCDQEQSCNNIGPDAKFSTRSVCTDRVGSGFANDLNAYKCPRGLDSAGVDRCVAAIQGEECSHPIDTLTRDDKCRSGALCLR